MLVAFILVFFSVAAHVLGVIVMGAVAAFVYRVAISDDAPVDPKALVLPVGWVEPLWYRRLWTLVTFGCMLCGVTLGLVGFVADIDILIPLGCFLMSQWWGTVWLRGVLQHVRICGVGNAFIASAHVAALTLPTGGMLFVLAVAGTGDPHIAGTVLAIGIVLVAPAAVLTLLRMSVIPTQHEPNLLFDQDAA